MTPMRMFEGVHWVLIGVLLSTLGVLTTAGFLLAVIWTGNVRLLAGVASGVVVLLIGLALMNL